MPRDVEYPTEVDLPITDTLATLAGTNAEKFPNRAIYAVRTGNNWQDVTAAQFNDQVRAAAKGLVSRGVEAGRPVAILSPTRYEWTVLDFAIWSIGAFAVPIYDSSSAEQIAWIVRDSRAVAVITDSDATAARVREAVSEPPPLWVMDAGLLGSLAAEGSTVSDDVLATRATVARPEDPATIVYTSGTTGRPKGCVITHSNLLFVVRTLVATTGPVVQQPGARTVLFLPLAHVLGRGAQVYCALGGMQVAHCPNPKLLVGDMTTIRPTFLVGVPRIFEKIFNASQQKAHAASSTKGRIFERAAKVAIEYGRATHDSGPSPWLKVQHALFDRLVYSKIRTAMGGNLRYAITGGASLGERLGFFFAGMGLTVMEGYGLTETTASGTFNRAENPRIGSVGQPMPGTAVRIADDGEIWLRGPHVMAGYHNNPTATDDAITADGWFQTGDLGDVDADGFLHITGRKKEIIVTAGGKNVAPAVLEDRMQAHNLIGPTMVVGDGQPFIAAIITLDPDALAAWATSHGKASTSVTDLHDDPDLVAEIQAAVDDANAAVSRAESIRTWRLLDAEFTEETGYLTPTQKLKRSVVAKDYREEIAGIYA
ncbi:MAG: long-chain fatty acid--CoA ligase [Candidatus Nanopelagicales bacterium]|nr:long-chain fatty acid--CoA ligase [Actinomycetota bacterium]HNO15575.1 long-chain fatty acid--CoA ligase [Actinomycetota bacterium]HUM86790.1 long-chain fatty acid--CoA ligase [Actinomycetota bacterium]